MSYVSDILDGEGSGEIVVPFDERRPPGWPNLCDEGLITCKERPYLIKIIDPEEEDTAMSSTLESSVPAFTPVEPEVQRVHCSYAEYRMQFLYRDIIRQAADEDTSSALYRCLVVEREYPAPSPETLSMLDIAAQKAANGATLTHSVLAPAINLLALMTLKDRALVLDALWADDPIPGPPSQSKFRLLAPQPSLTIGYDFGQRAFYKTRQLLGVRATPVICAREIFFPVITMKPKSFKSPSFLVGRTRTTAPLCSETLPR